MKIAIVTCRKVSSLTDSEKPLIPLFLQKGIYATAEVWDDTGVDWSKYDAIIIRSVWDYHLKNQTFSQWIEEIRQLEIKMFNDPEIVKWNQNKFYLKELDENGFKTISTDFIKNKEEFKKYEPHWGKAVIKPAISASSYRTNLFEISDWEKTMEQYLSYPDDMPYLIQKFTPEIQSFGELSLMFFNRSYAYTILKNCQ